KLACALLLFVAACPRTSGTVEISVMMPRPADKVVTPDGLPSGESGVIVDATDGSSVCQRVRLYVYAVKPATTKLTEHPADAPVHSGNGFGTYDPERKICTASAVLPAKTGYWAIVEYPYVSADDPPVAYYYDVKSRPQPPYGIGQHAAAAVYPFD